MLTMLKALEEEEEEEEEEKEKRKSDTDLTWVCDDSCMKKGRMSTDVRNTSRYSLQT